MTRFRSIFLVAVILQFACKALNSPSPVEIENEPHTADSTSESMTASAPLATSISPTAPVFLPSFGPDYFDKLHLVVDYWPAIRTAANLGADAIAAKSVSYWRYSSDGQYLAVAGCDQEVGDDDYLYTVFFVSCEDSAAHAFLYILDAGTGNIIATLPPTGQVTTVKSIDFNQNTSKLVYALSSGEVAVWDMASEAATIISQEESPYAWAEFSPNGLLIAMRGNPVGKIWDVTSQKFVAELNEPEYGFPGFSADGRMLQLQNYPNSATYDTTSWQQINSVSLQYNEDDDQSNASGMIGGVIDTSPDLALMAECNVETRNAPVGIWDLNTGEKIQTLNGTWNNCGLLQFTPDGKWLLRFDDDGRQLSLWQVGTWQYFDASSGIQNVVSLDDRYVIWLDFSADGQTVLVPTYNRLALYGLP